MRALAAQPFRGSGGARCPWHGVLLVLDAAAAFPLTAAATSCRLVPAGRPLWVLAPVRLPLTMPADAPPGAETDRAAALLEQAERFAGGAGVAVRGMLRRGRSVRALIADAVHESEADLLVLPGPASRTAEWIEGMGSVRTLIVTEPD